MRNTQWHLFFIPCFSMIPCHMYVSAPSCFSFTAITPKIWRAVTEVAQNQHWIFQGLWNILAEAFGFCPNIKFCRKSNIKRQSWEAADKLNNSNTAKDIFQVHFIGQRAQEKCGIKCSNAFSDLSRKYKKWFALYWCRPLKMDLSWLGNTFWYQWSCFPWRTQFKKGANNKQNIISSLFTISPIHLFHFPYFYQGLIWLEINQK